MELVLKRLTIYLKQLLGVAKFLIKSVLNATTVDPLSALSVYLKKEAFGCVFIRTGRLIAPKCLLKK